MMIASNSTPNPRLRLRLGAASPSLGALLVLSGLLTTPFALATAAHAQTQRVVNVDVGNGAGTYTGRGVVNDPGTVWNGITGAGANLLASDGTPTGVSVQVSGEGTFSWNNANLVLADYTYVSAFGVPVGTIQITGLRANTSHLIYVFSAGDKIDQAGVLTLNGVTECTVGSVSSQFLAGENFAVLEVVSDATGAISGSFEPLHTAAAINGLQITEGTLPPRVKSIRGATSPKVRSPGDTVPVTLAFSESVTLSRAGGAEINLEFEGRRVIARHTGATIGTELTFSASAPAVTTLRGKVVANSLRLTNGATLVGASGRTVPLDHVETPLPNDQVSVAGLSVYPAVPGGSESKHYRFRVREAGGTWQSPFAFFTKCVDFPDAEYGYYDQFIGGWSHTYCNFEMAENVPIEVEITRLDPVTQLPVPIQTALPHPRRSVKSWRVQAGKAYIELDRPALFAIDVDGQHDTYDTSTGPRVNADALHAVSVFANPFVLDKPNPSDSNVFVVTPGSPVPTTGPWTTLYFAPGVHQLHTGTWAVGSDYPLRAGVSYYIPGDAIVHGNLTNRDDSARAERIRIFGHGTLSGERIDHPIHLQIPEAQHWFSSPIRIGGGAKGCRVEGITLTDGAFHSCALVGGFNGRPEDYNYVRWSKTITWRANGDGFSPNGSGYVEDCFMRTQDDGTYILGLGIRRNVYWHDVNGMPLRCSQLTQHNDAALKEPLYVEDIDILYARTHFGSGPGRSMIGYPDPGPSYPGTDGSRVVFRNIRVDDLLPTRTLFGWDVSAGTLSDGVRGVRFENVRAAARNLAGETDPILGGVNAIVSGLIFDNVTVGGRHYAVMRDFATNAFATNFAFSSTAPETITYRKDSGGGYWHLDTSWDTGAEPADNDRVGHTAVAGVLAVDAPAYAGDLDIGHSGTATVEIREFGRLNISGALRIGTAGSGRLALRAGTLRLANSTTGALTIGASSGDLHIEAGTWIWAGDHIADVRSLHAAGRLTFGDGNSSSTGAAQATLIAQANGDCLFARYDATEDETSVFVVTPLVFGSGCGTPALTFTPDPAAKPFIGRTATATITNAPTTAGGVMLGRSNTRFGSVPLPLDLALLGMPGCELLQSADVSGLPTTPGGSNSLRFSLAVPNDLALVGATIYVQAYVVAPSTNPLGLVTSNGIGWTIGN